MKLPLLVLITLFGYYQTNAQAIPNNNAGKIADVENAEQKINQITDDSGRLFKEGLMSLQNNRRLQAREKFDKSVEVFLTSGINVRSNAKLQRCYSQLIETVYRMEIAANRQPPQIRSLSETCGWNIDNQLADTVAKLSVQRQPIDSNDYSLASEAIGRPNDSVASQSGFSAQKFEPSPLDELAKIELKTDEIIAYKRQTYQRPTKPVSILSAGVKPLQNKNGTMPIVIKYLNDTLNDPYSVRFVKWSKLEKVTMNGQEYWAATLKLRAKNTYNAYILGEMIFYIRNNKVVNVIRMN